MNNPFGNNLEFLSLDDLLEIRGPATYLVRVEGESMTGAGIFSGDLLVVSKAREATRGSIIIAVINGDACVKRLDFESKMPVLRSENRRFPPRFILEDDRFEIWGVVTHSLRAHDRKQPES